MEFQNYINGKWVNGGGHQIFETINPANEEILAQVYAWTGGDLVGPVLSIIEVDTLDEAIRFNNESSYGLSTSIFTQDVNRAFTAMRDIFTGLVYINHGTTGAEIQFPFGGVRGTGNGHREAGQAGLDLFTEWKSIYVDYSGKLQRAQIDNRED